MDGSFETIKSNTAIGINEAFAVLTLGKIDIDNTFNSVRHIIARHTGAETLTNRGVFCGIATERDLIAFFA